HRDWEFLLDDAAVAHRRDVVALRPARWVVLRPCVDSARLERLEQAAGIPLVVEKGLAEIFHAPIGRELRPPVIRIAREGDARSGLHFADEIGPAADGR